MNEQNEIELAGIEMNQKSLYLKVLRKLEI